MSDERGNTASKAGLWYTVGNILLKGCVFFTLPIFTRLLSTNDFGVYNSYIAYENLIQAVLGLGLYGTVKNAKLDFNEKFDSYISSVFSLSVLFFLAILLLANVFYPVIAIKIGFSRFVINCLLVQSFGSFFIHFYGTKLNSEFRYKPYLLISVVNTLGNILLSVVLILYVLPNERALGRILGSAFPPVLVVLIVGPLLLIRGKKLYDKNMWSYGLKIGLPLVPHVVSQSVLSQFDRIMIKDMVGASESGIYSSIYTICTITYVICLSIDNAWTPWLFYQVHDKRENEVFRASRKYVEFFSVITIGFMCVMPEISKIFLAQDYWSGIGLLYPIAVSNYCVFLYLMPVSIEYYHKSTWYISIGTLCAALLNLLLNFYCIKIWGFVAAAYTTWVSYFVLFLFHYVISKKYYVDKIFDIKHVVLITVIVFVTTFLLIVSSNSYFCNLMFRLMILFVILLYGIRNRGYIFALVRRKSR